MKYINSSLSTNFYADDGVSFLNLGFENDVKMYGTQAIRPGKESLTRLRMM